MVDLGGGLFLMSEVPLYLDFAAGGEVDDDDEEEGREYVQEPGLGFRIRIRLTALYVPYSPSTLNPPSSSSTTSFVY